MKRVMIIAVVVIVAMASCTNRFQPYPPDGAIGIYVLDTETGEVLGYQNRGDRVVWTKVDMVNQTIEVSESTPWENNN